MVSVYKIQVQYHPQHFQNFKGFEVEGHKKKDETLENHCQKEWVVVTYEEQ